VQIELLASKGGPPNHSFSLTTLLRRASAMPDLLLHGPPVIRLNSGPDNKLKLASQPPTPASKKKNKQTQRYSVLQPVSKIIRDASNYMLSWRDGLNGSEREDRRRAEERMQILAARMQNVSWPESLRACLSIH
jgi:TAG lipase / steryl ester hydrolase / phospholipase A2 / LPA acyltransferase